MDRVASRQSIPLLTGVCLIAQLSFTTPASAQDRRTVTEPHVPPACATVAARVAGARSALDQAEDRLDTERIQRAIDACGSGRAVALVIDGDKTAFVSGPLELRRGVTLLVGGGATLYGSRNPRVYDVSPGSCGIVTSDAGRGCRPLIHAADVSGAAVMGEGAIDGRGGEPLLGQQVSWWDLAQQAKVSTMPNAHQNCPRLVVAEHADDFTLYRILLRNSPNFHVIYSGNGFTAWGVVIDTPKTARNTDGIDPSSATNVTIAHCYIRAGDDNVAIKAGSAGPSSHISIEHNHFYNGHGMSIGSETNGGVHAVRVRDLSIDGADNGIRIKSNSSRGGLVQDVEYEDVCIRDTKNPIVMDTAYPFSGGERNKLPVYTGIVLRHVRVIGGGKIGLQGYDHAHRLGIQFDDVIVERAAGPAVEASHADVTVGPGPVNFQPMGSDVAVQRRSNPERSATDAAPACANKFVPLSTRSTGTSVIPLWPEGVPGAKANAGEDPARLQEHVQDGHVSNVRVPTLTYYPAPEDSSSGAAIVVCPGGGYTRLSMVNEGSDFARWLNAAGVSAFVLKYRLVEFGHPAPLQDVLRAIRLVRSRAAEFGIRPDRIGVMGSSAGGHLAASAATLFDAPEGRSGSAFDATSARPDFVALLYPVITMKGPFAHAGSRRSLLGDNAAPELIERLSVETQVTRDTPPAFLVHTEEDTTVPVENSVLFYQALRRAGVPVEMHLYEKGPHGFGARTDLGPTSEWPRRFIDWMRSHGWIEARASAPR